MPRPAPAQVAPAAAPSPALSEQIRDQIASRLPQLQQTGRVEAQLNLHPPELGRLQLHLSLEDGRLSVRMLVQDDNVKRMLDQQIEPLRVRFAEMGVSVGQFDVRREGAWANPNQQEFAASSAQTLKANNPKIAGPNKSYATLANSEAAVDVIA